jgi:hypothetical protein
MCQQIQILMLALLCGCAVCLHTRQRAPRRYLCSKNSIRDANKIPLGIAWQATDFSGWGIFASNLITQLHESDSSPYYPVVLVKPHSSIKWYEKMKPSRKQKQLSQKLVLRRLLKWCANVSPQTCIVLHGAKSLV